MKTEKEIKIIESNVNVYEDAKVGDVINLGDYVLKIEEVFYYPGGKRGVSVSLISNNGHLVFESDGVGLMQDWTTSKYAPVTYTGKDMRIAIYPK